MVDNRVNRIDVGVYCDDLGYVPTQATAGSAGGDLRARLAAPLTLWPDHAYGIKTGVHLAIPDGCVGLVCPRSGLSSMGVRAGNGPGVIDSDYRGEIEMILWNTGAQEFIIEPGARIGQIVILPAPLVMWTIAPTLEDLGETDRGADGFGSTGLS